MMWTISTLCLVILISITKLQVHAKNSLVPCYFIFGDSLSDSGNNNGLKTLAKANYLPYGIDFPGRKATGRFTNGRTALDIIAQHVGIQGFIQPFSTAKGHEIRKGVNYASGAAGILPETGQHTGDVVSFDKQIQNHKTIVSKLNLMMNESAQAHLRKCLYTINIGSNDYMNNYFMPEHYKSSQSSNPDQFATSLIDQYRDKLKILYQSGATKVAVFGLGRVGCTLGQVMRNRPKTVCVDKMNDAASLFNSKLQTLVAEMNHKFSNAKFTFINTQAIDIGPQQGITVLDQPCCQLREDFMCKESSPPCNNRNAHYFWDGYHPTEAVCKLVGNRAFKASNPVQAIPMDISSLVKFKL